MEKKIYEPGVYSDISNADYHASAGISRSGISEMQKSPLHYWDRYLNPNREREEPTEQMLLGSAVHTLVLEPEKFELEFVVLPKIDGRTKEGKATKALFEESAVGKYFITEKTYELAKIMADETLSHPRAQQLLHGAVVEHSIYWNDRETGALCKTRPDIWNRNILLVGDLKTAKDSTPGNFYRTIKDGNYHIQAAMQIDGIYETTGEKMKDFMFIVVQNERPFKPYIYNLDKEAIEAGRKEYKEALKIFDKCFKSNDWNRDRHTVIPIFFRPWQVNESTFYKLTEIYQCNF